MALLKVLPDANGTPTVTHYQEAVALFQVKLKELEALVPYLQAPQPSVKAYLRTHKGVPAKFIATTAQAVVSTAQMEKVGTMDVEATKDAVQYEAAFRLAAEQVLDLYQAMQFTCDAVLAKPAAEALESYRVMKAMALTSPNEELSGHVLKMRRDLGRSGSRPKKVPAPAAQPVPIAHPFAEKEVKKAA
jgi:hypothetical protein